MLIRKSMKAHLGLIVCTLVLTIISGGFNRIEAAKPVLPESLMSHPEELVDPPAHHHPPFIRRGPTIQVAILLDTSNSMDGLIHQARARLWSLVNDLARANLHNRAITLQVGLFEYGKSSLARRDGYLQMLSPLTGDLDLVSERLFALHTNGGSEYAGQVIRAAVNRLNWSRHPDDLRLIIIAGNEAFEQGYVRYAHAIKKAVRADIIVNTIFCGPRDRGIQLQWQDGAIRGRGKYMSIRQNDAIDYISTPYDQEINRLGSQLNTTSLGYGTKGAVAKNRQQVQDAKASAIAPAAMADRAVAKAGKQYDTSSWDLTALYQKNKAEAVAEAERAPASPELQGKSKKEIAHLLEEKNQQREEISAQIADLEKKRAKYIKEKQDTQAEQKDFGTVLIENIRQLAQERGYSFSEKE